MVYLEKLLLTLVLPISVLTLLIASKAMGQEKHTFDPLPSEARVISEKDGERIAEWKGVTIVETSKERRAKESIPTIEEANKIFAAAKPKIVRPPNDQKEVDVPFQPKLDPSRLIPGENLKKNSRSVKPSVLEMGQKAHILQAPEELRTARLLVASASSGQLGVSTSKEDLKIALSQDGALPHSQPYQFPFTRNEVIDDYTVYPNTVIGTLAFTDPRNGQFYTCTAAVVNTLKGNTIFTAGHCVGESNTLFTNFIFRPATYLGSVPFGQWTACGRYPTTSWLRNSDYTNDIAAIKLCPRPSDGASIKSVVQGSLGLAWGQGRNWNWTIIGYPATAPFTNGKQYFCQSSHGQDDPAYVGNPPFGVGCDMQGGASGSPYLLDYGREYNPGNFINGVYSYNYSSQTRAAYSSYFGQNAKDLYDAVVANGG